MAVSSPTMASREACARFRFASSERLRSVMSCPIVDQDLYRPPQQFVPPISEELFGLRIDQDDFPLLVDYHHSIGRRLQKSTKLMFRFLLLGDVVANGPRPTRAASIEILVRIMMAPV